MGEVGCCRGRRTALCLVGAGGAWVGGRELGGRSGNMLYQGRGWRKPGHPQGGGEEAWQLAQWTGWGLCGGLWGLVVELGMFRMVMMGRGVVEVGCDCVWCRMW